MTWKPRRPQDQPRSLVLLWGISLVLLIGAVGVGVWSVRRGAGPPARTEEPLSTFLIRAAAREIAEVTLCEGAIEYRLRDGRGGRAVLPPGALASGLVAELLPRLVAAQARVEVRPAAAVDPQVIVPLVLFVCLLLAFVVHRQTGRVPLVGGRADAQPAGPSAVTFADVAGVDEAKEEVREIVDFLRAPQRFAALGGRSPRGVLLVGPPGTGKTLLARSMAGEAGVPFLFVSGADFVEMYAGVGAARVRRLFKEARRHSRCIVFIDEIDCLGRRRGSQSLSHEEREQALNQLLVEMDGFAGPGGVVVVGATNRQDILDPALLRPGRFDRQVVVGCPDLRGREQILQVHAQRLPLAEGVDLREVARGTPGMCGADLANLLNEAAILAARAGRPAVTGADLGAARDKVLMGPERRSLVMSQAERVTCAYHEAGHAIVAALSVGADPVHKVSIVPRGRALGVTMQLPEADRHTHGRTGLLSQLAVLLGGRAAEEIFLGEITSGAANDIERATELAQSMVCELGMSPLGPVLLRRAQREGQGGPLGLLGSALAEQADQEVQALLRRAQEQAAGLLRAQAPAVQALAERLLEVETVDGDEVRALLH